MKIKNVCGKHVISIGELNLRFRDQYLEIVNVMEYPNVVYNLQSVTIQDLGIVSLFEKEYLVIKTTRNYPENVLTIPINRFIESDRKLTFKLLKEIVSKIENIHGGDLEKGVEVEGCLLTGVGIRFNLNKFIAYSDIVQIEVVNDKVRFILENGIEVCNVCSPPSALFLARYIDNIKNDIVVDDSFFKKAFVPMMFIMFSHVFYYENNKLSIYSLKEREYVFKDKVLIELKDEQNDDVQKVTLTFEDEIEWSCSQDIPEKTSSGKNMTPKAIKMYLYDQRQKNMLKISKLKWIAEINS